MLRLGAQRLIKTFVKVDVILKQDGLKNIIKSESVRNTSFFNKVTANELWKGVISVSNAGKKRGRGRGTDRKIKKNFNIGQKMGVGKEGINWPGLTTPLIQKNTVTSIKKLAEPIQVNQVTVKQTKKNFKIHPLLRGWSGKTIKGKLLDPPPSKTGVDYSGFHCITIENKLVATMTAILGRKRRFKSVVLAGNGNGVIGIGTGRSMDSKSSVAKGKHRAMQRLYKYNLIDKKTVNHDFFTQFNRTKIFVYKRGEGHGLICHRVIAACCKLLGIENLYAKVEGSTNAKHVAKAFLIGLLKQKTYQEIAEDKKLHLVEYNEEKLNFPTVVASPKVCLTSNEIKVENTSFYEYIMGDRVVYNRPKQRPFYEKLPSWQFYLKKSLYRRDHKEARQTLLAEYGETRSFLADRYPECRIQCHSLKTKEINES